jgi:hypothetical protein
MFYHGSGPNEVLVHESTQMIGHRAPAGPGTWTKTTLNPHQYYKPPAKPVIHHVHYLPFCYDCNMCSLINASFVKPSPQLPDQLKPFLILLDNPEGLPVCCGCQAALLPKSVLDHLRKQHQLPAELRGIVKSLVATLPSRDFADVPNEPDGSPPLEALRVVGAFQCKHCPFIRRDVTDVRKHINQEHSVSATGNYDQIEAQSWFGGRRAIYWRVCDPPKSAASTSYTPLDFESEGPPCLWGLYGKGFGDKSPMNWPKGSESHAEFDGVASAAY